MKLATTATKTIESQILKLCPGLGAAAQASADVIANSGVSRALATMIVTAVYTPGLGTGQSTKSHWFVDALKSSSYGNRLAYFGSNKNALERFVSEMDAVDNCRETLKSYCSFSFADCFYLSECGIGESEAAAIMADLESDGKTAFQAKRILMKSAKMVLSGECATINSAIEFFR